MYRTGKIKVSIEDKEYLFSFGMNAFAKASEEMKNWDDNVPNWLRVTMWAALKVREENKLDPKFSPDDVGDLLDAMTEEDSSRVMEEALEALGKMTEMTLKVFGQNQVTRVVNLMQQAQNHS